MTDTNYDPNEIVQAADTKYEAGDLSGAQKLFKSALLEWVDDAQFGGSADDDGMQKAISELWIAYAKLNRKAKMNKSAAEAFEAAVNCPIAGSRGNIWLEYAKFYEERDPPKHKSAQKVYLRALVGDVSIGAAVQNEEERNTLWNAFLCMMQSLNNNSGLTMEELRSAVEKEHVALFEQQQQQQQNGENEDAGGAVQPLKEEEGGGNDATLFNATEGEYPPTKRPKIGEPSVELTPVISTAKTNTATNQPAVNTFVPPISAKEIEDATAVLIGSTQNMPPEFTAAWYARDGDAPPSRPEPPLFTPSPPKSGDASGKGILGDELALRLIKMLSKKTHSSAILLDICRGCWMMTALKEKEAAKALAECDERMRADMEALETNLEARTSVAEGAALPAVQQVNENERNSFILSCNQTRQQLLDNYAWQFRHLLAVQQQILTKANLPGFEGPTVDVSVISLQSKICGFMHQSFYLRAKIGEDQHISMLKKQEENLSRKKTNTSPPPPPPHMPPPPPPPLPRPLSPHRNNQGIPAQMHPPPNLLPIPPIHAQQGHPNMPPAQQIGSQSFQPPPHFGHGAHQFPYQQPMQAFPQPPPPPPPPPMFAQHGQQVPPVQMPPMMHQQNNPMQMMPQMGQHPYQHPPQHQPQSGQQSGRFQKRRQKKNY